MRRLREQRFIKGIYCSLLLGAPWLASSVLAQDQTPAQPIEPLPKPPELPTFGNSQFAVAPLPPVAGGPTEISTPLHWGKFNLRPWLTYRFSSGNGLQSQPGQSANAIVNEVATGFILELGKHWSITYSPTMRFYASGPFKDSTDHSISLSGGTFYHNWSYGLNTGYSVSSQPLVETASQTSQESYATSFNATHLISENLTLSLGLNQSLLYQSQSVPGVPLNNSRSWGTSESLDYKLTTHLSVGLGASFGYDTQDAGFDMLHEEFNGRIHWQPGEKLSFSFHGGIEDRQFLNSSLPSSINPVFGLTMDSPVQLSDTTTLSFNADRSVSTSPLQNTVTVSTDFGAILSQRLLKHLNLTLGGGYRITSYEDTTAGLKVNRRDNTTYFNARLSMAFLKRATVSVFFDSSDSPSSAAGFNYSTQQMGFELGYRF